MKNEADLKSIETGLEFRQYERMSDSILYDYKKHFDKEQEEIRSYHQI